MKIFELGKIADEQSNAAGGKARGLDKLVREGFNVPAGFVITGIEDKADFETTADFYLKSGFKKVAVRSSADVEDGAGFSYAGQFKTVLNVDSKEKFIDAIRKCMDSLNSVTAKNYNDRLGGGKKPKMNIVVQKMLEPQCAGVCFTTNPNNPDNMLVEAVEGLGEQLVSGAAAAKQYIVAINEIDKINNVSPPLTAKLLRQICKETLQMQNSFNLPLDTEWAAENGELYWLQVRPVTVTENCAEDEFNPREDLTGHAITRCNISEMLPGAVTPLSLFTTVYAIDWGIRKMLNIAGANKKMKELPDFAIVFPAYGHLFMNLSTIYRITRSTYLANTDSVDMSICDRVLKGDEAGIVPGKNAWFLPRLVYSIKYINFIMSAKKARKRITKIAKNFFIDSAKTDAASLYNAITTSHQVSNEVAYLHYIASGQSGAMSSATTFALDNKLKNPEKSRAVLAQLLERIDGIESVDILASLRCVAQTVLNDEPQAKNFDTQQLSVYLKTAGENVQTAVKNFMKRHGHRAIREAELRSPGWANDEKAFVRYLKTVLSGDMSEPEKQPAPDVKAIVKENGFKGYAAKMLVYYANQAREGVKNREYSKSKLIKVFDVFKQAYVRLAKMLAETGRLPDEDAIYFLTHNEIGLLVNDENAALVKKALQRRRLLNSQAELNFAEGYTKMPEPLAVQKPVPGEALRGTPVSRGIATGPARVVKTAEDAAALQKGEIMIARFTDIGWSPFYCLIEGLVTEVGSALSHGAVVAREYALPLVANVAGATSLIKTGEIITIDGSKGIVTKKVS